MELTMRRAGSELTPEGSVDLVSRQQLVDAGLEVLQEHGALTVNMSEVDFLDSVGIGALIELSKKAASLGAAFAVVEPSRPVQRVLAVAGLADVWVSPETSADSP